ncbi:hypothetical protein EB093_09075 [bacterium]|nr:hypothetical protein [bacterium]
MFCLNNPVRFVDPDGRENKEAAEWARLNLSGSKTLPYDKGWIETRSNIGGDFSKRTKLECKDLVYFAYSIGGKETDMLRNAFTMKQWFQNHGTYIPRDKLSAKNLEVGDVFFMGKENTLSHVAMVSDINADGDFSVQGAHKSTGTDILRDRDGSIHYFKSIKELDNWLGKTTFGIGQQKK